MVATTRTYVGRSKVGETGRIAAQSSIFIDGGARQITLPKALRKFLKGKGWTNGPTLIFYNEDKDCIETYSLERIAEKMRQVPSVEKKENAAGLICRETLRVTGIDTLCLGEGASALRRSPEALSVTTQ